MYKDAASARTDLLAYGRKIEAKALVVGPGGNTSARAGDVVYMKASGCAFEDMAAEDYIGVDLNTGDIVDGEKKPTCEVLMHLGCYKVRDDVAAVGRTRPPYATALASCGVTIPPIYPDFVALLGTKPLPLLDYIKPAGSELADAVIDVIKDNNGVLMSNHGVLTVGKNVRDAYFKNLLVEEAAKTFIAGRLIGGFRSLTQQQSVDVDAMPAEDYRRALLAED
jgi:L-fuculose-phosphate aldolase